MNNLDLYLSYLNEDIKSLNIPKRKWYDLLSLKMKNIYKEEIQRVFEKHFVIRHPMIDNRKTEIKTTLPLVFNNWYVEIKVYDKQGNDPIDYEHESNALAELPFTLSVSKKGNNWTYSHEMLFLKDKYKKAGLGRAMIQAANVAFRKLKATKKSKFVAVDIGKYAWSRLPGTEFRDPKENKKVETKYQKWCKGEKKSCKPGRKPSDYPKEFLLSKKSPGWINYTVPI